MLEALRVAAGRSDAAVLADRRTWRALADRGLVDVQRGRGTGRLYQGPFRRSREYTTYDVVTGVYINDEGRAVLKRLAASSVTAEI